MRTFMVVVFVGALVLAAWANNPTDAAAEKIGSASTGTYSLMTPTAGQVSDVNIDY
jgi:hypothetical protein